MEFSECFFDNQEREREREKRRRRAMREKHITEEVLDFLGDVAKFFAAAFAIITTLPFLILLVVFYGLEWLLEYFFGRKELVVVANHEAEHNSVDRELGLCTCNHNEMCSICRCKQASVDFSRYV